MKGKFLNDTASHGDVAKKLGRGTSLRVLTVRFNENTCEVLKNSEMIGVLGSRPGIKGRDVTVRIWQENRGSGDKFVTKGTVESNLFARHKNV